MTNPAVVVALAFRFVLELCALAALAFAGWAVPDDPTVGALLAVALPVTAGVVWGRWVAPKSPRQLRDPARLAVEVLVFGAAGAGLWLAGAPAYALALTTAYALDTTTLTLLGDRK